MVSVTWVIKLRQAGENRWGKNRANPDRRRTQSGTAQLCTCRGSWTGDDHWGRHRCCQQSVLLDEFGGRHRGDRRRCRPGREIHTSSQVGRKRRAAPRIGRPPKKWIKMKELIDLLRETLPYVESQNGADKCWMASPENGSLATICWRESNLLSNHMMPDSPRSRARHRSLTKNPMIRIPLPGPVCKEQAERANGNPTTCPEWIGNRH